MLSLDPNARPSLEEVAGIIHELINNPTIQAIASTPARALSFAIPEKRDYCELAGRLRMSWESSASVSEGLQLSEVLCLHLSQFNEAQSVLERTLYFTVSEEEKMRVRVAMVAVSFYREDYHKVKESSLALLTSFPKDLDSEEMYWELGHYLSWSWTYGVRLVKPENVLQQMNHRCFIRRTPIGRIYRTLVKILATHNSIRRIWLSKKILALCLSHSPPLMIIARALDILFNTGQKENNSISNICKTILSTHFPVSSLFLYTHASSIENVYIAEHYFPDTHVAMHVYSKMSEQSEGLGALSQAQYYGKFEFLIRWKLGLPVVWSLLRLQRLASNQSNESMTELYCIKQIQTASLPSARDGAELLSKLYNSYEY